jgi:hypothetical protein
MQPDMDDYYNYILGDPILWQTKHFLNK